MIDQLQSSGLGAQLLEEAEKLILDELMVEDKLNEEIRETS